MYHRNSRASSPQIDDSNQDSFLDIITNIVGILIILVMVTGLRVKQNVEAKPVEPVNTQLLAALRDETRAMEQEIHKYEHESDRIEREIEIRNREREMLGIQLVAGQQAIGQHQQQLSQHSREQWELQNALASARNELTQLQQYASAPVAVEEDVVQIESFPTPLGRTVYGKEIHYQVRNGRIAYVPFDELVDRAKGHLQRHRFTPQDLPERTFDIGPISGYKLLLTMQGQGSLGAGQIMFTLKSAEFVPVDPVLGETLETALAARSEFRSRLLALDPQSSSVAIWFYPDGFSDFRALRKNLYEIGFATAGWPLTEGRPISASPQGMRSSVQ